MRVITVNSTDFQALCQKLAERIFSDGYRPDCIIGIRNGGAYVAREVAKSFSDAVCTEVTVSRPTHKQKNNKWVKSIFRILPVWLLNAMRMTESGLAQFRKRAYRDAEINIPCTLSAKNILVVDDAIDTGATMLLVINTLRDRLPECEIRSAVVTITTPSPSVTSNYYIFNNRTLIRFPWAIDSKI